MRGNRDAPSVLPDGVIEIPRNDPDFCGVYFLVAIGAQSSWDALGRLKAVGLRK